MKPWTMMLAMMCRRHHVPFIARGVVNGVLHDRAVAAACVDVDAGSPRSPGQLLYQRRTLFSDEYLRIDEFNQRRNKVRLTINDESQFKERLRKTFETSGLKAMFADDLTILADCANDEDDVRLLGTIIRSSLTGGNRQFANYPKLITWYFALCKLLNLADLAQEMWHDPVVQQSTVLSQGRKLRARYFTLLYENELYQELVNDVKADLESATIDDCTLAMAALCRLNTEDTFAEATEIMKHISKKNSLRLRGNQRIVYIYSYFAMIRGEYGLAYDTLTVRYMSRTSKLSTNLKLLILAEVGRFRDALNVIHNELIPPESTRAVSKRVVCFEVMQRLSRGIREENGNDPNISQEFSRLCKLLDESAILTDESLEDTLFSKIGEAGEKTVAAKKGPLSCADESITVEDYQK